MLKNSPVLRVLVIEDEPLIRWSITETLAHSGCSVIEAPDGATAVRTLTESSESVDLVLLDYRLPDSNDLTLLSKIRHLAPTSSVILMTAYGTPEVTKRALELGVCRVLNKPFDMADLTAVALQTHGSRSR